MKTSQLAINSISTRQETLEEALDAYAAAGFKNVEFYLPLAKTKSASEARSLLDARGLRCVGGFEGSLVAFGDEAERAANRAHLLKNAQLLEALGATTIVVGTDGPKEGQGDDDVTGTIARALEAACSEVAAHNISICIEFNWSPVVKSLRTAAEIARQSGAANAGVLFDPAHYHCTPTKFEQISAANVPFIRHVHLNDMRDIPGEMSNCNSDRVLPGSGCLDLRALIGAIESNGYNGLFSIEMFSDELWALPAAEAARRMYQSLLPYCD
jgi:4-hydroxyphenylpyruvate dioxygenase